MGDQRWPSGLRAALRDEQAQLVREGLGDDEAEAFRVAARLVEWELADGRGGEELHSAAEAFCAALVTAAEPDDDDES
jgi:hypothetical protein